VPELGKGILHAVMIRTTWNALAALALVLPLPPNLSGDSGKTGELKWD
jgi:hypothetical protein